MCCNPYYNGKDIQFMRNLFTAPLVVILIIMERIYSVELDNEFATLVVILIIMERIYSLHRRDQSR